MRPRRHRLGLAVISGGVVTISVQVEDVGVLGGDAMLG